MERAEKKKIGRYADSAEDGNSSKRKKRQNDHRIKPYASHSSFVKSGHPRVHQPNLQLILYTILTKMKSV